MAESLKLLKNVYMKGTKITIKNLLNFLAVLSVFTGMNQICCMYLKGSHYSIELRVAYLLMIVVLLAWAPLLKGIYFNRVFLAVFSVLFLFSMINVFLGNTKLILLMKQVIGILGVTIFYYTLLKVNNYDVKPLFKIYLNVAFFVALIGIIQEVSFLLNFRPGYEFTFFSSNWEVIPTTGGRLLQINSIFREPSHFCAVILPAGFVAITQFFRSTPVILNKWKSVVILLSIFFSFSAMGYVGLLFSVFIFGVNRKRVTFKSVVASLLLVFVLYFLAYTYIVEVRSRIGGAIALMNGSVKMETANVSVFALFTNAKAAGYSFMQNPFFGSGLGSHEVSYGKCIINKIIQKSTKVASFPNYKDAASFFLRLISETGLFGAAAFFIFMFKFYVHRSRDRTDYLWIISNSMVVMFLVKLIRMGHYFADGFFFFFWIYYFTGKALENREYSVKANIS